MELRHLRYFVAVAEELNFRRAAARLRLAQPSLGRQIKDLEEEVGAALFERDRQHVALTDAGNMMLTEARQLLESADNLLGAVRDAGRGFAGSLRIGNIGPLTGSFLPDTLSGFREAYPRVDVEILELGPAQQFEALLEGSIQIGFYATHLTKAEPRLAHRPIIACGAWAVLPMRHRLASERTIAMSELAQEPFLTYVPKQGAGHEEWLESLCREYGHFKPRVRRKPVDNWSALFSMVAAKEGITILPTLSAREMKAGKGWLARRLRVPKDVFELSAVWKAGTPSPILANYLPFLGKLRRIREPAG
jgi:DNA-binding transcriptional LysR family regulator